MTTSHPPDPATLRVLSRRGRPYRPEVVDAARALLSGTTLRIDEVADRTGVGRATIARWARAIRFVREAGELDPAAPLAAATSGAGAADDPGPGRPWRYGPAKRDAARALIEETDLGLERIGLRLGIGSDTLARWKRQERWTRPPNGKPAGPPRYRTPRGRPYATDAVETVRSLVVGTRLSQARIAAIAGISQSTVCSWIRRRGWTRPPAEESTRPHAAARRTAPLATSGSRRGRPYHPEIVALARALYEGGDLPTSLIAARAEVSAVTVALWARAGGWTRPRELPDPQGRPPRRRRPRLRRASRPRPPSGPSVRQL